MGRFIRQITLWLQSIARKPAVLIVFIFIILKKKESGWNNSSATSNALRVLKDQAQVAGGNAVIIRDIYSSEEYREGYQLDAAGIYVDVYKCPFDENKEKID
mgnify:CR=1 FL=1